MVILPVLCSALIVSASADEPTTRPPIRDLPTEAELNLTLKQSQQQLAGTTYVPQAVGEKAKESASQDLMKSSEILCFAGAMTLVPKHAVLQIPKNLAVRLKQDPGAQLVTWSDFYPANRSWINTIEVTFEQAEGKVPLSAQTNDLMTKSGKVIVATYNGNPISVLTTNVAATTTTTVPTKPISRP